MMRTLRDQPPNIIDVDVRQITRFMEGVDLEKGACTTEIKKRTNRVLSELLKEKSVLKTGKTHGNFDCYKLP